MSSNKCCNIDRVFMNFNKMADGRHFTDYRSHHEMDIDLYNTVGGMCKKDNNSYDNRICLQRNTHNVTGIINNKLNNVYNVPRCDKK